MMWIASFSFLSCYLAFTNAQSAESIVYIEPKSQRNPEVHANCIGALISPRRVLAIGDCTIVRQSGRVYSDVDYNVEDVRVVIASDNGRSHYDVQSIDYYEDYENRQNDAGDSSFGHLVSLPLILTLKTNVDSSSARLSEIPHDDLNGKLIDLVTWQGADNGEQRALSRKPTKIYTGCSELVEKFYFESYGHSAYATTEPTDLCSLGGKDAPIHSLLLSDNKILGLASEQQICHNNRCVYYHHGIDKFKAFVDDVLNGQS